MSQQKPTALLSLPPELRSHIFEHVLTPLPKTFSPVRPYRCHAGEFFEHRYRFTRREVRRVRPLLSISHQIRAEIIAIIFAHCTVTIEAMAACFTALSNFSALQAIRRIEIVVPVQGLPEADDPWQEVSELVVEGLDGYHYYAQNYIRFKAWSDMAPEEIGRRLQVLLPTKIEEVAVNFVDIRNQWLRPDCVVYRMHEYLEAPTIRDQITRLKFRTQYVRGHKTPYYELERLKTDWDAETMIQGWRMCPWRYLIEELARQCPKLQCVEF